MLNAYIIELKLYINIYEINLIIKYFIALDEKSFNDKPNSIMTGIKGKYIKYNFDKNEASLL